MTEWRQKVAEECRPDDINPDDIVMIFYCLLDDDENLLTPEQLNEFQLRDLPENEIVNFYYGREDAPKKVVPVGKTKSKGGSCAKTKKVVVVDQESGSEVDEEIESDEE